MTFRLGGGKLTCVPGDVLDREAARRLTEVARAFPGVGVVVDLRGVVHVQDLALVELAVGLDAERRRCELLGERDHHRRLLAYLDLPPAGDACA
jgi:hypothetical protein